MQFGFVCFNFSFLEKRKQEMKQKNKKIIKKWGSMEGVHGPDP